MRGQVGIALGLPGLGIRIRPCPNQSEEEILHPPLTVEMPEVIQESLAVKGKFIVKLRSQVQRTVSKNNTEAEETKHFQSNFCF